MFDEVKNELTVSGDCEDLDGFLTAIPVLSGLYSNGKPCLYQHLNAIRVCRQSEDIQEKLKHQFVWVIPNDEDWGFHISFWTLWSKRILGSYGGVCCCELTKQEGDKLRLEYETDGGVCDRLIAWLSTLYPSFVFRNSFVYTDGRKPSTEHEFTYSKGACIDGKQYPNPVVWIPTIEEAEQIAQNGERQLQWHQLRDIQRDTYLSKIREMKRKWACEKRDKSALESLQKLSFLDAKIVECDEDRIIACTTFLNRIDR